MLLLLFASAAAEWTVVGVFAAAATCFGAVKLGLETYEKALDVKKKSKEEE